MGRKKAISPTKDIDINDLSYEDEFDENGFDEMVNGTPLANFNFNESSIPSHEPIIKQGQSVQLEVKTPNELIDHRKAKTVPNGITPPIDGEAFDIRRTYQLRESTVRKLNELKAAHPDINVYLNTILDDAINHYYKYIFLENRFQK
ncbi:hypothetical protein CPJCM30710_10940 [Clostridium polyendosporum]|uniref:Uncharacterized protein n=1 Tax=Clostridium polyendosporum TaxID=69208 RepID=A0A919VLB2_9CLOT|nr:hypothetical protein [Clostridium polyendosporum]GIM28428.1 hypothetical protein CPJCM30710_10940 [Clostridium polyendosporum]